MYTAKHLFDFNGTAIMFINELAITCFSKGMAIDADGHPFAYHPENTGLDDLQHAGYPGNWWGIATHDTSTSGEPIIQKGSDPAPGYFVTTTSMTDERYLNDDPRRYIDAAVVPYFVLPDKFKPSINLGDIAWIFNRENRLSSFAVFADTGPDVGEGSIYLAGKLGIDNDPRYGGISSGVLYFIFDGSRKVNGYIAGPKEIWETGTLLMKDINRLGLLNIFT